MNALLHVEKVGKRFGGFVALQDIDLEVQQGERLGLIGPNGSGKSTLVNCICGTLANEQGSVRFAGAAMDGLAAHQRTRLGLARSFQLPRPFGSLTLAENLRIPILYAVNAIAMPLIGGTSSWLGPVVGAVLVGGLQQYVSVTISSAVNVLVAGVLMVAFVILAPQGIVGLFQRKRQ